MSIHDMTIHFWSSEIFFYGADMSYLSYLAYILNILKPWIKPSWKVTEGCANKKLYIDFQLDPRSEQ